MTETAPTKTQLDESSRSLAGRIMTHLLSKFTLVSSISIENNLPSTPESSAESSGEPNE